MDPNRRTKMLIIAEILETSRRGVSRNQIMSKVNLNSRQMWQYLRFVCQNDLLSQKKDKVEYETTDTGFRFLKHYYKTIELLHVENTEDPKRAPKV